MDLSLEVGAVADSVTVTAEAPLVDSTSTSTGVVLDNKAIMGFPTLWSNPEFNKWFNTGSFVTGANGVPAQFQARLLSGYFDGLRADSASWVKRQRQPDI